MMNHAFLPAIPPLVEVGPGDAADQDRPWELWWITANLDRDGRRLCAHLMINRMSRDCIRVTATITDVTGDVELTERAVYPSSEFQITSVPPSITTSLGEFSGTPEGGYRASATFADGSGFELMLKPTRPVVFNGGAGQFTLGTVTTAQYSMGDMLVNGALTLNGETAEVSGQAWYDRQWSVSGPFEGVGGPFNWFGLSLDSGETLSIWDTTMREGGGHSWATIARPDGTHIVAAASPTGDNAQDIQQSEAGRRVANLWTLTVPAEKIRLEARLRRVQDGERLFIGALEVQGTIFDKSVTGHGFCDLIGSIENT